VLAPGTLPCSRVTATIDAARHRAAGSVNAIMTATHWAVGRRIEEHGQQGSARAQYGEETIAHSPAIFPLASDEGSGAPTCSR